MWSESREFTSAPRRDSQKQLVMLLRIENSLLDLWFEGSHHANPHEPGAEAKSKSMASRDQVMAVVQALELQQGEATGTSPTPAEPINEVARAFLLSTSKQNAGVLPSPTQNTAILPSATQNARIPPSATPSYRIEDPGRLAVNDSLIKSRCF